MAHILTLNAGSSSLKFGLFSDAAEPLAIATGLIGGIGGAATIRLVDNAHHTLLDQPVADGAAQDHAGALNTALSEMRARFGLTDIGTVGHRVVHGGRDYGEPTVLNDAVLAKLEQQIPFAPLHQPHNLAGVRAALAAFPDAPQVACFDTAFHRNHPYVNDTFALPRRYYDKGVRRYGFHGLSYTYIMDNLARHEPALYAGRVVVAHLGNGASMCGIKNGQSIASSMGFTALDGLPMGTRCGQLDPGVLLYLIDQEGLSTKDITAMLYKDSGLLGLSGISHDMRQLLDSDAPEARQAIDYFTFRIRRELGGLTAALKGLDALVFTGGIGENAAPIRDMVCADLHWLGVDIDAQANAEGARDITAPTSKVQVRVIPTNEELVIARAAAALGTVTA